MANIDPNMMEPDTYHAYEDVVLPGRPKSRLDQEELNQVVRAHHDWIIRSNMGGGSTWHKMSFSYADLSYAGTTRDFIIGSLPVKTMLSQWIFIATGVFAGPGLGQMFISISPDGANLDTNLASGVMNFDPTSIPDIVEPKVSTTVGQQILGQQIDVVVPGTLTPTDLYMRASSDINLDQLTAGSFDLYLDLQTLP